MKKVSGFNILIHFLFIIITIITLYPFWYTLIGSLLKFDEFYSKIIYLWPSSPTLEAYFIVLKSGKIIGPLQTTVFITVVGTVFSLFITTFTGYALSKKFPGSRMIMMIIVFTMFFNGGIIPTYILYRNLHLINQVAVYILPMTINTFNLIVMRTNLAAFPPEIEEASKIDGCSAFGTFIKMVLPLSLPILATIGLFCAVSYWNTLFPSLFYITDPKISSLQDYLYRILKATDAEDLGLYTSKIVSVQSVKMAATIIVIAPIIAVYPFLQKYFVSGVMIGAVKG